MAIRSGDFDHGQQGQPICAGALKSEDVGDAQYGLGRSFF